MSPPHRRPLKAVPTGARAHGPAPAGPAGQEGWTLEHKHATPPDHAAAERPAAQPASRHLDPAQTAERQLAVQRGAAQAGRQANAARLTPSAPELQRRMAEPVLRAASGQRDAEASGQAQRAGLVRTRRRPAGAA